MTGTGSTTGDTILTLNAGSSSIKFALYDTADEPCETLRGQVENLGAPHGARLTLDAGQDAEKTSTDLGAADHARALSAIFEATSERMGNQTIVGVGHRIAHGGVDFAAPARLTDDVLTKLRALEPLAPLHQPHNLAAVDAARGLFPDAPQIGCFDTAFHRGHPWVNDTFALPRQLYDEGVRRYGFHGLSYDYVTGTLQSLAPDIADKRVAIAHLGNGASMCAVQGGQSVASTMGFTALDGLPMGTRCGQLDPGVLLYLMDTKGLSSEEIAHMLYRESGLKGLSGDTNDMRVLEASDDPRAAQAIDYYVFRIRRELGAMAAILGGLDAVVFCGGIGENSATIRGRVCDRMDWLGISIDETANAANETVISRGATRVLVVPTDEERVIARAVVSAL